MSYSAFIAIVPLKILHTIISKNLRSLKPFPTLQTAKLLIWASGDSGDNDCAVVSACFSLYPGAKSGDNCDSHYSYVSVDFARISGTEGASCIGTPPNSFLWLSSNSGKEREAGKQAELKNPCPQLGIYS